MPDREKKTLSVRVRRDHGACSFCGAIGHVIFPYDPRIFEGKACPDCIVRGRVSLRYSPDGGVLRPMVFVARALRGEQPFARLLKAAEAQRAPKKKKRKKRKKKP